MKVKFQRIERRICTWYEEIDEDAYFKNGKLTPEGDEVVLDRCMSRDEDESEFYDYEDSYDIYRVFD